MVPSSHINDIFIHFGQNIDQNWKISKSEVAPNISQSDSEWSLLVISSDILVHSSQKVYQNWKIAKSEVGLNFT